MTLNAVVLPAPFGPIRPEIWPSSTENDTPSSATIPPKRRVTSRTSSRAIGALPYSRAARPRNDRPARNALASERMDLRDTPEETTFRAGLRAWLEEHLP